MSGWGISLATKKRQGKRLLHTLSVLVQLLPFSGCHDICLQTQQTVHHRPDWHHGLGLVPIVNGSALQIHTLDVGISAVNLVSSICHVFRDAVQIPFLRMWSLFSASVQLLSIGGVRLLGFSCTQQLKCSEFTYSELTAFKRIF